MSAENAQLLDNEETDDSITKRSYFKHFTEMVIKKTMEIKESNSFLRENLGIHK